MLDLKVTGGTIIDGSGQPGFRGDVGVKNGRIVTIGDLENEPAAECCDATGRIVSPGFIDVHTHYDAQVFWDPTLSPSCYHGVTTIVGGFCGFSIAPITPESAQYIRPMLAKVEGMPLETLERAVLWNWSSFGEFLARIDGKVGLNAGFFAGHSAIRRIVMGRRAVGEKATSEEIAQMKDLLDQSLEQGALGFSTTLSPTHNDGDGNPVPSRWADRSELLELARVVSRHEGTGLELLPGQGEWSEAAELLADFSIAGNRPVNWNVLVITGNPDIARHADERLRLTDFARERGGEVIALTTPSPLILYLNLRSGDTFDSMPGAWREIFKIPVPQRIADLRNPELRQRLANDLAGESGARALIGNIPEYTIVSTRSSQNKKYEGRKIEDIAAEEEKQPIDVLFDVAIADGLDTVFLPALGGQDRQSFELRGKIWADDRTIIGASDAGAHLDMLDTFAFSTTLLEKGVREHKVIGLEQAIHQITHRAAQYFGFVDRGLIADGYCADIVVFDPDTVARGTTYQRYDLPGGKDFRLYADAEGIDHVFVNGIEIVRKGKHTGRLPGKILRSGQDTRTMPMNVLQDMYPHEPDCA